MSFWSLASHHAHAVVMTVKYYTNTGDKVNRFLRRVQAVRDSEAGLHHDGPSADPFEKADALRMELLNELTKPQRCKLCGGQLKCHLDNNELPLTVCSKCGGRKMQNRLERKQT